MSIRIIKCVSWFVQGVSNYPTRGIKPIKAEWKGRLATYATWCMLVGRGEKFLMFLEIFLKHGSVAFFLFPFEKSFLAFFLFEMDVMFTWCEFFLVLRWRWEFSFFFFKKEKYALSFLSSGPQWRARTTSIFHVALLLGCEWDMVMTICWDLCE